MTRRSILSITSSDPLWTVYIANITGTGSNDFQWMVWKNGGFDLGAAALGDTWVIHIDTEYPQLFLGGRDRGLGIILRVLSDLHLTIWNGSLIVQDLGAIKLGLGKTFVVHRL